MKNVIILLSLVLTSTIVLSNPKSQPAPGWHHYHLKTHGSERYFRYYIPKKMTINMPLVILLHGGTQSMDKIFNRHSGGTKRWPELAEESKFILIAPNGTSRKDGNPEGQKQIWNDCRITQPNSRNHVVADDVSFISELIDWSSEKLSTNTANTFITGASNGGLMSYRLAIELPNKISAVAAFIANMPKESECPAATHPVPMLILNSTKDPFMPWNGGDIVAEGGQILSSDKTFEYWKKVNHLLTTNIGEITFPDINSKDHSVIRGECLKRSSEDGSGSAKSCFYRAIGAGHVTPSIAYNTPHWIQKRIIGWQNKDVEGADLAWQFFTEHIH